MYSQIQKNRIKSLVILFSFVIFGVLVSIFLGFIITVDFFSSIISGLIGFSITLIFSLITYFFGDKITLSSVNAIDVTDDPNYKELNDLVEILSIKAGIPKPKVYVLPEEGLNAFATGRNPNNSHVAFTQGLLENLDKEEISAVIAHELAHIKNYDIRLMLIVSVIAGSLTFIADIFLQIIFFRGVENDRREIPAPFYIAIVVIGIIIALLMPLISTLVQLAISRRREFLADATAVEITRYPEGLIRALEKISNYSIVTKATEGNAHMFFSFPLPSRGFLSKLFSTHPPIEERIEAIRKLFA